ncbi:MAG: thiamine/thiamine pyrophosphate ABC transporter permease ThiP [Rubellimicrobium sp.]|nr:thiamine/thiamine pyrophosphate ABC transporter permease ThiP [Rubellimicrobium sp.]
MALVLTAVLSPPLALLWRAGGAGGFGAGDLEALRFTLWQAFLSAAISVTLAVPVARALARRRFRGRGAVIALLGAPFILPVLAAVIGLLAVLGRNGVLNQAIALAGLPRLSIYGPWGVVLAHVFLNLPLAVRMILTGWQAIPDDRFRLAASLGAPVGRILERPMLRAVVPGAFLVIFLVCLTSFTVALTLGGGPRASTLELAIYQALRFDFAPGRAAVLGLMQVALGAGFVLVAGRLAVAQAPGPDPGRIVPRWDGRGWGARAADAAVLGAVLLFLVLPLLAVVLRGIPGLTDLPAGTGAAAGRTLLVALAATAMAMALAMALALHGGRIAMIAGTLPMALSGMVLGAGLMLLLLPVAAPAQMALPVTAALNALAALPFALHLIAPELARIRRDYGRLADTLGVTGAARLRIVILPLLRRPLGLAAGLAAALSVGDLGVIALFATPDQATLPLLMVGLMGAYRIDAAAALALVLAGVAFGLFLIFDLWGRHGPDS